ncbi:SDR family NAD(P)-dependent oxidoreductase [Novosphingobium kaempferiae]|uniref:SDR family NAD(P)-dependent oxidoreductase n=1 Tax=Novosphingobium kaempferiae TaxID=2896849 RepID=UPI001E58881E|nr:SDR family oxidoreductase [Novosphingobium kaempferiae]
MRVSGKIAIVTGAFGGIGSACTQLLAAEGATVYAADRALPADPLPDTVIPVQLDVSSEQEWGSLAARVAADFGRLDILVNNAGIGVFEDIASTDLDNWNEVIAVNQTGVMLGMREFLPLLVKAQGSIVNVSSMLGIVAQPGLAAYHATKAAVLGLTRNAAVTYAHQGVRANAIHPGIIDVPRMRARDQEQLQTIVDATPLGRRGRPEDVAMGVLYLASDESRFVTGASLVIDGGYTAR